MRPKISATIIALNEEADLPRCLKSLMFVDEIVLIDSGSIDRTVEVAKSFGAKVVVEPWHGYGAQKNFAQRCCKHPWVLNVDADEEIPPTLRDEILRVVQTANSSDGFAIARKTFYLGRWIRFGGWYPNYVTRLCHKDHGRWTEPQVHESLTVPGAIHRLSQPMHHFTFSNIADQVRSNVRYATEGANQLWKRGKRGSLALLVLKPLSKFVETYFFKLGFLDGLAGLIISVNAAHSAFMKYAFLREKTLLGEHDAKNSRC